MCFCEQEVELIPRYFDKSKHICKMENQSRQKILLYKKQPAIEVKQCLSHIFFNLVTYTVFQWNKCAVLCLVIFLRKSHEDRHATVFMSLILSVMDKEYRFLCCIILIPIMWGDKLPWLRFKSKDRYERRILMKFNKICHRQIQLIISGNSVFLYIIVFTLLPVSLLKIV